MKKEIENKLSLDRFIVSVFMEKKLGLSLTCSAIYQSVLQWKNSNVSWGGFREFWNWQKKLQELKKTFENGCPKSSALFCSKVRYTPFLYCLSTACTIIWCVTFEYVEDVENQSTHLLALPLKIGLQRARPAPQPQTLHFWQQQTQWLIKHSGEKNELIRFIAVKLQKP